MARRDERAAAAGHDRHEEAAEGDLGALRSEREGLRGEFTGSA